MRRHLAAIGAAGLLAGIFMFGGASSAQADEALTEDQVLASDSAVISEVKTQGSAGVSDEFIEISNRNIMDDISLSGWQVVSCSATGSQAVLFTFPAGSILSPYATEGSHYLLAGNDYSGAEAPDQQLPLDLSRTGGVLLRSVNGTVADAVGFSSSAGACVESSPATAQPSSNTNDLSSQRNQLLADTDQNRYDFGQMIQSPQSQTSP